MKRTISTLFLIHVLCFIGYTQSFEGMRYLGGEGALRLRSSNYVNSLGDLVKRKTFESQVNLSHGWFVNQNLLFGINSGIMVKREASPSLGVFTRLYPMNYMFLSAGYTRIFNSTSDLVNYQPLNNTSFGIGFPIFLTGKIAVEPTLEYSILSIDNSNYNVISFKVKLGIYLPRKNKTPSNENE